MNQTYGVVAVSAVVVFPVLVGALGLRISRITSDFSVATRSVPPHLNAVAVSGEYLSAASFLGVAGLILAQGVDMLWFPIGYTAGFLVLLAFVAAPLRRSGAYTLPDFAETRLESRTVRRIASMLVVGVGWLYLLLQLRGAGLTLRLLTGSPRRLGGLVVAVVVTVAVAAGGMHSITFVQAFQYWVKLTALLVPAVFLLLVWRADHNPQVSWDAPPAFRTSTQVHIDDPLSFTLRDPVRATATGTVDGQHYDGGTVTLDKGTHHVAAHTTLGFPRGARVPVPTDDSAPHQAPSSWAKPLASSHEEHSLYATYGLILATFLGSMGLPHVVVRFYTNPDGRAARHTTVIVLGLRAGAAVRPRPAAHRRHRRGGSGAAAAADPRNGRRPARRPRRGRRFRGLPVHRLRTHHVRRRRPRTGCAAVARYPALPAGDGAGGRGTHGRQHRRQRSARSQRCRTGLRGLRLLVLPLPVLGIWWRGLMTPPGAVAGLLLGGGSALTAVAVTIGGMPRSGWLHALMAWPAVWSVPMGFAAMVLVSLATRSLIPASTGSTRVRLHLPEALTTQPKPSMP